MPWWVATIAAGLPALWALYLLWRVEVWKRRLAELAAVTQSVKRELVTEKAATAALRLQVANHQNTVSYLKDQITEAEGEIDACAADHPGAVRERLRNRLRAMSALSEDPGST